MPRRTRRKDLRSRAEVEREDLEIVGSYKAVLNNAWGFGLFWGPVETLVAYLAALAMSMVRAIRKLVLRAARGPGARSGRRRTPRSTVNPRR